MGPFPRPAKRRGFPAGSGLPTFGGMLRPALLRDAIGSLDLRAGCAALGRVAVGLVYPPVCIACGAATAEPHTLCGRCWAGIRFIERPFCERLGTPFAVDLGMPLVSPAAFADPPVFARAPGGRAPLTRRPASSCTASSIRTGSTSRARSAP